MPNPRDLSNSTRDAGVEVGGSATICAPLEHVWPAAPGWSAYGVVLPLCCKVCVRVRARLCLVVSAHVLGLGVSHAARASAAWGLMSTSDRYPGTVCTACLCFMAYLLSGHRYAGRDVAIPDPAAYLHTLQQTTTVSRQIQSHKQSAPAFAFGLSGGVEKHIGRKVRMEVAF